MMHTPASIRAMILAGLGVDDVHVRTGWSYSHIAAALSRQKTLEPWTRLASKRVVAERRAA